MSELLAISNIKENSNTQPRLVLDQTVIVDYSEAMKNGEKFPPVDVFNVGGEYLLTDGYHRIAAARLAGIKEFLCEVHERGTIRDAILHSCEANGSHGLRRTEDDKIRAVKRLMIDFEWSKWSDYQIAKICHVSHTMVAKYRGDPNQTITGVLPCDSTGTGTSRSASTRISPRKKVTGVRTYSRKGKVQTMKTTNIGEKKPRARRSGKQHAVFKCPEIIQWEPSAEQREYIVQAIASGKFGSPDKVVSTSIDRAMKSEGM